MSLKSLIVEATRYARFTMKQSGCLTPMMMAVTDQACSALADNEVANH